MPDFKTTGTAALIAALLATSAPAQTDDAADTDPATEAEAGAETPTPDAAEAGNDATEAEAGDGAAPADAPATLGLAMGQEDAAVGQPYTLEEHGDWDVRCVRSGGDADPCQLYQLLKDDEENNVAEVSIFPLPDGAGEAVAGATIITPLETFLPAQIALTVDNGAAKRYPFSWCSSIGCFSRVGFTAEEIAGFRRGARATLSIVPVAAPDQSVDLTISLSGFTAGYEAVAEANAGE